MLKFFLLSFLLLGLSVSGEMNEDTEVATLAADVNLNEKTASQEMSQEDSSEEEENNEEDDSGAVEEFVSENDKEEFDQNDDFGSEILDESNEQDDSAGARRGWRFRCKRYRLRRGQFMARRRACHRCVRSRRCRRACAAYYHGRRMNHRRCMMRTRRAYRIWNIRLRRNWLKIAKFNKQIVRHHYAIRMYRRRIRHKRGRFLIGRKRFHRRKWLMFNRRLHANYRAQRSIGYALRRNWNKLKYWRRRRCSRRSRRMRAILKRRRRALLSRLRRLRRGTRYLRKKIRFHRTKYYWYHRRLYFNAKIHAHLRAIRAIYRRRAVYLRRRRIMWHKRRMAGIRAQKGCRRRLTHLWKRCHACKGGCGKACYAMHQAYARMIFSAHACSIRRMYCHRRVAYHRAAVRYANSCRRCKKRTHARVRLLRCAGVCGASYKYRLLSNMYRKRCH